MLSWVKCNVAESSFCCPSTSLALAVADLTGDTSALRHWGCPYQHAGIILVMEFLENASSAYMAVYAGCAAAHGKVVLTLIVGLLCSFSWLVYFVAGCFKLLMLDSGER
jgi:hypothetical protein